MTPREQGIEVISREDIKRYINEKIPVEFLHAVDGYNYYRIGNTQIAATINEDHPVFGVTY